MTVNMTVTTDDEDVRRTFEPSRPSNSVRLRAIAEVRAAGIDACVTMTPLLLVGQPNGFADSLIETGLENFIVQPFQFNSGKFIASTREPAVELMAQKLGCNPGSHSRALHGALQGGVHDPEEPTAESGRRSRGVRPTILVNEEDKDEQSRGSFPCERMAVLC